MRASSLVLIGFVLTLGSGCSPEKHQLSERTKVSGKVTLEGNPLTTGNIVFTAETGEPPKVLDILDGNYEGEVPIGPVKVSITSTRQTTMKEETGMDGPGYDEVTTIDILPNRYKNMNREIKEGDNTLNFDLKAK